MHKHAVFTMLCVFGIFSYEQSHALDRSEALSVLKKSDYFPRYETLTPLPMGNPVNIEVVIETIMRKDTRLGNELNTGYACAKKLGLLQIRGNTKKVFGTNMGTYYNVSLTEEGEKTGRIVRENVYGYTSGYVLPIYKITAVRVTGIKNQGSGSAIVDFDTGISEILPAGRCVHPNIDDVKAEVTQKHRATLELFDDGWRVESVKAKGKHVDWISIKPDKIK